MKKQYKKNKRSTCDTIIDTSNFRDAFFTFLAIFILVFYQSLIPISLALAEDGSSSDPVEEVQDDTEDEEDDAEDEESDTEDEEDEEDDAEDEEADTEDEEDDGNEDEESEKGEGSDEGESASSDDNLVESFSANDSDESNENECGDECSAIEIENVNETDVVTEINSDAVTGENNASGNGVENDEDDIDSCDINYEENESNNETDGDEGEGSAEGESEECSDLIDEDSETLIDEVDENIEQDDMNMENEELSNDEEENEDESECTEGDDSCAEDDAGDVGCEDDEECSDDAVDDSESDVAAEIITGDAQTIINILNNVNTNIVGENWAQLIYDIQGIYEEDINLFEYFEALIANADESSLISLLDIYNENVANITNAASANVNTGDNIANGNDGNVNIETGDAIAGVNIVNIANQNLVGNNWLFSVINVFGLWTGDLIVPGEGLLEGGSGLGYSDIDIINENRSNIENNVDIDVTTGNNSAVENGGDAIIETGEIAASINTSSVANTNIVGDNWFFLMINNMGSWTGNVLHWNSDDEAYQSVFKYAFDSIGNMFGLGDCDDECSSLNVHNNNIANIQNDVTANVNTGGSIAEDNSGDVDVSSGDALAWVNIFNFVNNNIVGNSWMFSIVNVMGEWTGDAVFAYPDLEVSISDGKSNAIVGESLDYTIIYHNKGGAAAESVEVMVDLPSELKYHSTAGGKSPASSGGSHVWKLEGIASGETKSIVVTALIDKDVDDDSIVKSVAAVRTDTAEVELDNNYATDQTGISTDTSVLVSNSSDMYMNNFEVDSDLKLSRTSNIMGSVQAGEVVVHQIIIENKGNNPIYDIELRDVIKDITGETLLEYEWDAGNLYVDETTILEYALIVNEGLSPSEYQFYASAVGNDVLDDEVESNEESVLMAIAGGWMHYAENVTGDGFQIIPEAHANEVEASVGMTEEYVDVSFWIWFISVLLYALIINWTLFPKRKRNI